MTNPLDKLAATPELKAACLNAAKGVADEATRSAGIEGAKYEVVDTGDEIRIRPANYKAQLDDAKHSTLFKAMSSRRAPS